MKTADEQYLNILTDIKENGTDKGDRTGVGTRSVFGKQLRFDISDGKIPLLTTKKVFTRGIVHELIWMLSGDTNIRYLKTNGVNIWDSWIDPDTAEYDDDGKLVAGDLPNIYQKQWRHWEDIRIAKSSKESQDYIRKGYKSVGTSTIGYGIFRREVDQIANLIHRLKTNPDCRRMILSAWNVGEIDDMALAPCHAFFQLWTRELSEEEREKLLQEKMGWSDEEMSSISKFSRRCICDEENIPTRSLSSQMYQRSLDVPLGGPFNIVFYSIMTQMIAQVVGMTCDEFIWSTGDTHVYTDQVDGVREWVSREPMESTAKVKLNPDINNIFDFKFEDVEIVDYQSHPAIKFPKAAV